MLIKVAKFVGLGLGLALTTVVTSMLGKQSVQTAMELTNDVKAKFEKPEVVPTTTEA